MKYNVAHCSLPKGREHRSCLGKNSMGDVCSAARSHDGVRTSFTWVCGPLRAVRGYVIVLLIDKRRLAELPCQRMALAELESSALQLNISHALPWERSIQT